MAIGKIAVYLFSGLVIEATVGLTAWTMALKDKMDSHCLAGIKLAETIHATLMNDDTYRQSPPSLRRAYAAKELRRPLRQLCKNLIDRHSEVVQKYVLDNLPVICNQ